MVQTIELNTRVAKAYLWTSVVLFGAMLVSMIFFMHLLPPPAPSMTPEAFRAHVIEHKTGIRVGTVIMMLLWSLWVPWAAPLIGFVRKMERGIPLLTYTSIALVGGGLIFFLMIPLTWAVMAFRPETLDPGTLQIINDWVFFNFLYSWPPFGIWMLVVAYAILTDHNKPTLYPRWVGYVNIWCCIGMAPTTLIVFFHTGPFAYDGIFGFYIPVGSFFVWLAVMTVVTFQLIARVSPVSSTVRSATELSAPGESDAGTAPISEPGQPHEAATSGRL